ncbi:MAG: hypothetical protein ACQSGP_22635 [Frankia sp.]
MSLLGNALDAMATCDQRWQSLHAEIVRRVDRDAEQAAREAEQAAHGSPTPVSPPGAPRARDIRPVVDERRGLLTAAPAALRVAWGDRGALTVVRDGHWRRRRPDGQVVGQQRSGSIPDILPLQVGEVTLVHPWAVLAYLRLSAVEALDREGRAATRLRGVPRQSQWRLFRFPVAPGDSYDLTVDDATGVLVDLVAWFGAREVVRHTLHDVRIDGPVEAGAFELDGVGSLDEAEPVRQVMRPLATLARDVDFTLFEPTGETYVGHLDRRDDGPVVNAHPVGGRPLGQLLWFRQSRAAGMADPAEWDVIELPDGTPARWWSPDSDPEQGHLRFERGGTQIWVQGRGIGDIRDLASKLHPIGP